jgi:hypothetical protein
VAHVREKDTQPDPGGDHDQAGDEEFLAEPESLVRRRQVARREIAPDHARQRRQLRRIQAALDRGDALALRELDDALLADRLHDAGGDAAHDRDDGDREDEERDVVFRLKHVEDHRVSFRRAGAGRAVQGSFDSTAGSPPAVSRNSRRARLEKS